MGTIAIKFTTRAIFKLYLLYIITVKYTKTIAILHYTMKRMINMNLNLRQAILTNVSGNSQQELENTIVDAIQRGEEKMLPGLGVLFEVIWENATEEEKHEMLQTLEDGLKQ